MHLQQAIIMLRVTGIYNNYVNIYKLLPQPHHSYIAIVATRNTPMYLWL